MNFELIRSIILFVVWPTLVVLSIFIIYQNLHYYFKKSKNLPIGKLILTETISSLISLLALSIVIILLLHQNVILEVQIIFPIFTVWLLAILFVHFAAKNKFVQATKIHNQSNKIKKRAHELEQIKIKLDYIAQNIPSGAVLLDNSGNVIFINQAAKRIIGLKSFDNRELLHELYKKFSEYKLEKLLANSHKGNPVNIPNAIVDSKHYLISIRALLDEKSKESKLFGHLVLIQDITNEKVLEQSKNNFLAVASHKLRTPLTGARNFLDLLLQENAGSLNSDQKTALKDIEVAVQYMIDIVNQMLNATEEEIKKIKVRFQKIQLDELIRYAIYKTERFAGYKDFKITYEPPDNKPYYIETDPDLLNQVVMDIINNSIIYSKPKFKTKNPDVIVGFEIKGDNYLIGVKDKGIGVPDSAKNRVFTKFFRAANALKVYPDGAGINLSIDKEIIYSLGGRIWFKSEENKQTTFYISLPKEIKK
jgi:two-component system sensor histidine kinase VicK